MTTVPFKSSELLQYVSGWRPAVIDVSISSLSPHHLWNYLGYLKIDDRVEGISEDQLASYMTTKSFVRCKGLTELVQNALFYVRYRVLYNDSCPWSEERLANFVDANEEMLAAHCLVLKSLPALLSKARGGNVSVYASSASEFPDVGVNFVHVFEDPLFLIALVPDALSQDVMWTPYYNSHFEEYRYGGDNLIWFVNKYSDNLLFQAMA